MPVTVQDEREQRRVSKEGRSTNMIDCFKITSGQTYRKNWDRPGFLQRKKYKMMDFSIVTTRVARGSATW